MEYAVTVVRINKDTKVFENTELNEVLPLKELELLLIKSELDFGSFEEVLSMRGGASIILQSTVYTGKHQGVRFIYIHRIN